MVFKPLKSYKRLKYDKVSEELIPYLTYQEYRYVVVTKKGSYLAERPLTYPQFLFYLKKELVEITKDIDEIQVYPLHLDLDPTFKEEKVVVEEEVVVEEKTPELSPDSSLLVENELDLQEQS